jgi:hypothetical protein
MSTNFSTITGTQGFAISLSTEETIHAASVRKPKNIGDTSLASHPSMRSTTEPPRGKSQKWRLPADFWTAIEKRIQHLSQDTQESTNPPLPFQISVNPIRNHPKQPSKNKIRSDGRSSTRAACHTSGSNLPPRMSARNGWTCEPKSGAPNSSQQYGTTPFEYDNSSMMHSMQIQMHK